MDFKLTIMNTEHLSRLADLETLCFSDPWSENAFWEELQNPRARFMVAVSPSHEIIGYLGLHFVLDEGEIVNVAVSPSHRRKGVAAALLADSISFGKEKALSFFMLEVRAGNEAAQALYQKFGFIPVGRRKNYYQRPLEDAILMRCDLPQKEESR